MKGRGSNIDTLVISDYLSLKEICEIMEVAPRTIDYYCKVDTSRRLGRPVFPECNWVDRPTKTRYWKKKEVVEWLEITAFHRRGVGMVAIEVLERDFIVPIWPIPEDGFLTI